MVKRANWPSWYCFGAETPRIDDDISKTRFIDIGEIENQSEAIVSLSLLGSVVFFRYCAIAVVELGVERLGV